MNMKSLFFFLAAGACAFAFGCNDDDKAADTGTSQSAKGVVNGAESASATDICKFLVSSAGDNLIEMNFNPDEASSASLKKAESLCVEEIDGLPLCKNEVIALYSCESRISDDDWIAIDAEIAQCAEDHDCDALAEAAEADGDDWDHDSNKYCRMDCFDNAYPCTGVERDMEKCWNAAQDGNNFTLSDYLHSFADRYKGL